MKKAHPNKKTTKPDQKIPLSKLDSKDSEEEDKKKCHGFAHHEDMDFGMW